MSSRRTSDLDLSGRAQVELVYAKALVDRRPTGGDSRFFSGATGRRVLVTGAGGSIGSELVTQIATLGPAHITLVDSCEFNLYQVSYALDKNHRGLSWTPLIGDVRDEAAMRHVFMREKPDVVFHAAALKHVPLLEDVNVVEAVRTNVLGTKIILDLSCAFGADFLLISTDKAVNPASCMGLTKRVAEIYVHDRASRFPDVRAGLVRFGNVIGSSGSVIPLFEKQIAAGGPVTITHPKMTRYLMTIEQAVKLTLAASSLPQYGFSLYVLDMGRPVRIVDLAIEMIKRAGKRPFEEIEIQFVGVRPGEKLHEELSYQWEILKPTEFDGVRAATPVFDPAPKLQLIDQLLAYANAHDEKLTRSALREIVPEYVGKRRDMGRSQKLALPAPCRNGVPAKTSAAEKAPLRVARAADVFRGPYRNNGAVYR